MKTRRAAALATVLLMALMGCSSDSPTEPSTGGGSGGSNNPPTSDIAITLTAANPNPVVGSSTLITARATTAGNNVVDGTAIEFSTTFGNFVETAEVFALRTTASGAATVTLTSATAGTALVTARLGAISRTITVTFKVDGGGGGVGPTISSVNPASGPPAGNQIVTITGTNLKGPVRVFFGGKEATIVSATETEIRVITPPATLAAGSEFLSVDVRVITEAGTPSEGAATLTNGYRYEQEILTPSVTTLSPTTGPNEGNTRFTIFGSGFQSPVKVFFGSGATEVEVEVISVTFSQIQAITPPASGLGASFINNTVSMRVLNLASNTQVTFANAFRYGPMIEITGFQPATGSHLGGDRITIFGFGFDDPVSVSIGDIPAQVIRVSGTEVIVLTSGLLDCGTAASGPITVTNLEQSGTQNNTATSAATFTYLVTTKILGVSPLPLVEGGVATITVDDPGLGAVKFSVGGKTVFPTSPLPTDPFAVTAFTIVVPTGFNFDEEDCLTGGNVSGTRNTITDFDVVFENILNGCTADISVPIAPLDTTCVTDPEITVSPAGAFGNVNEGTMVDRVFTVTNIGGVPVSGMSISGVTAPFNVQVPLGTTSLAAGASTNFTIRFSPPVTGVATLYDGITASVNFTGGSFDVALSGTGVVP
ncbi:MAG: IPT/TIG domain-containing protein [Thermoanaerobaculia bacterium]